MPTILFSEYQFSNIRNLPVINCLVYPVERDVADGVICKIFSEKFCTLSLNRLFCIVMYLKHHTKSSLSDQNFAVKSGSKNSCPISFLTLSEPDEAGFAADTPDRSLC